MPDSGSLSLSPPLEPCASPEVPHPEESAAQSRGTLLPNTLSALIFAVVAGALVWFFAFKTGNGEATSQAVSLTTAASGPGARVGQPAPDFRAVALDGLPVELRALRGRPVWVAFWATWCPPCRAEAPEIEAAFETYRDQGLVVVAVDVGESFGTVRDYAQRAGLTFTVAGDPNTEVAAAYRVTGLPTHVFIDAEGVVRDIRLGALSTKVVRQELAAILAPSSQPEPAR
jgi:peroxiredoxin